MQSRAEAEHIRAISAADYQALRRCLYLSVSALIWAIGLSVIGALVAATDAGAACTGWPLCNGQISPTSDFEGTLTFGHRFGSFAILLLSAGLVSVARMRLDRRTVVVTLASSVFALVLFQSVVGGAAVVRELPGILTGIHLLLAFAVTGTLAASVVAIQRELSASKTSIGVNQESAGLLLATVLLTPAVVLLATRVDIATLRTVHVGSAGGGVSALAILGALNITLLAALAVMTWRAGSVDHRSRLILATSVALLVGSATLTALLAISGWAIASGVIGIGLAAAGWAGLAALMTGTFLERPAADPQGLDRANIAGIAKDFLRVSKPGIMVLLLVTTLGAMLIASAGWPSLPLVLLTLLGGALASGGASALNCYHDRDIDGLMARTRKRPIPTGGLSPAHVRAWGITLSVLSVLVLAVWVNPLAAMLALAGNIFYVEIYTKRLKRTTPQNIVLGGAAGSFPPLVGWAAATGSLSLGAFLIAALVYYWTPPHFWSLALLKANDYRRAGIPMLPVTRGEHETRRRIVLYSLLLVAITLLMVPAGVAGWVYGVTAAVLGAWFVVMALRMFREDSNRLAWPLFKYSNYYLAALLAAMVIDHALRQILA